MKTLFSLSALFLFLITSAQSFKEKEVKLPVKGGDLYGTILTPKKGNGTAVVFISGSGPTDRDGNSAVAGKNNSLKMLAQNLGEQGYASLRVDKRAIGKSMPGYPEKDLRFETYIDDIVGWIDWLKANNKEIKKIVIVGHSEGSLIGMIAAQKTNADGFISIAGTGFAADSIIKTQLESQLPTKLYEQSVADIDSLKAGLQVKNPPALLMALFRPDVQPYIQSWFQYNPRVEIAKINCPIIIIQGLNDIQVAKNNAEILAKAAPKAQLLLLDKVTHVLKEAGPTQPENLATYSDGTIPISPAVLKGCLDFLAALK